MSPPPALPCSIEQLRSEGRLAETPDLSGAFPRLEAAQVATLAELGERRPTRRGEVLVAEGEPDPAFYVVLDGLVTVLEGHRTPEERVVRVHGPGRFLGELGLLTGQKSFFTTVVAVAGEVLAVPIEQIRKLVTREIGLGEEILRAYLARRGLAIGSGVGFRIIGSRYSADTVRLRQFASRNRLPHRFIDLDADTEAERTLRELGIGPRDIPLIVWGKHMLRNPSNTDLAATIGLTAPAPEDTTACDLLVVGAGPAGLAAAVYGASEGLGTRVLDAVATGGQAATSSRIENYLGFPAGISGAELAERAVIQADKFGVRTQVPVGATALRRRIDGHYVVELDAGGEAAARAVVLATGARYRKLPVPRLDEFEETSVFYAATPVEARICAGDPVVVVGGGNSAGQATVFLADHVAKVWLVVREHALDEFMSRYLADRILADPRVDVLVRTEVRELVGERGMLEAVVVEDTGTGKRRSLDARELMVFIGATPCTSWLADTVELDAGGYVRTGSSAERGADAYAELGRAPLPLETSAPGVFAAGDVRSGSVQRVASAVGEGAMVVRMVHQHLAGLAPHVM